MVRRSFCLFFIYAAMVAIFMSGCGKKDEAGVGSKKPVEIKVTYWGGPEELKIIEDIIVKWQASNPDIKVVLEHTPYRGYVDKLLTRIAGNAAPDVICTEVDLFVTFQTKNALMDLTPYVQSDPEMKISEFYPAIIDRFTVDGKLYAIPRDVAPFACVYYNKRLFDEANVPYPTDDWNMDDLLDKAKKLTRVDSEGRTTQYGFYAWAWQNFVYAFDGSLVDNVKKPTKCTMDSPGSVAGLKFYSDMINVYKVHPSSTAMMNLSMNAAVMFQTQRVAMFSSGIWETPDLRRGITDFDWDVVMFPKGPSGKRAFGTGGSGYSVLRTSKHPKEAYEVIKALTNKEAQTYLADTGLAQPAIKEIAESSHWAGDNKPPKNKRMVNDAMKYVVYDPFSTAWREAKDMYIIPELDLIFNGKKTVEQAVKAFTSKVTNLLQGGRSY